MSNKMLERVKTNPELSVTCQRCGKDFSKDKVASIAFRDRMMTFCEGCFKAVFKYDESLRTVSQIYEENGRRTPFTIRSNNWHRSSFMIVNDVRTIPGKNGAEKAVYVGDFYLRGVLKEQSHNVGKANHYIWTPWSAEEAAKYVETAPLSEPAIQEGSAA